MVAAPNTFRARLKSGEPLMGTFIKTPAAQPVEVLAAAGLDFVVVDQEHAPFDRVTLDTLILAGRAASIPVLVRVPGGEARDILPALDCGAQGVLVPHVDCAARAQAIVAESRYRGGHRGFTNSSRAGGYGSAGFLEHVAAADAATAVLAMVEDPQALEHLPAIMATPGLDAVFIGRGDLATAMAADGTSAPPVMQATERIAAAARAAGLALCAHVDRADSPDVAWLRGLGVTALLVATDLGLMRRAAAQALTQFRGN